MCMELFPIILPTSHMCFVVASHVSRPHPSYFLNACQPTLLFHYVLHLSLSRALSTFVLLGPSKPLPPLPTMQQTMPTTVIDTGEGLEALQTVAPKALVTYERLVSIHDLGIPKPNVPRALKAVDAEHPNGTPGWANNGYSVLQQHVSFFDFNKDGVVYPWETFAGFRALGFGLFISTLAMIMINIALSYPSQETWFPSPWFPIYIKNVHRAKHGSDSSVYDTEGRFVPEKFEEIFFKYAKNDKTKLYFFELIALAKGNRNLYDYFGSSAQMLEWGITYVLLKDENGPFVCKEHLRGIYDGSLFEKIALERASKVEEKEKCI